MRQAAGTPGVDDSAPAQGLSGEVVATVERGLAVLHALAQSPGPRMRPGDLVRATGLPRSTVDRILATLTRLGYLRTEDRDVLLTPRLMEIGNAYLRASGIPDELAPCAAALAEALDESVSITVPDRDGARLVAQSVRGRAMPLAFRIGDLLPAERCSAGPVFAVDWTEGQYAAWRTRLRNDPALRGFPAVMPDPVAAPVEEIEADFKRRVEEAARMGWSVDDEGVEPGLLAVSVPVRDPMGRIACVLNALSHTNRHTVDSLREHSLTDLRETAWAMESRLLAASETSMPPSMPPARGGLLSRAQPPVADRWQESKREMGRDFLQTLARGLDVLTSLGSRRGGLTPAEAADATALPQATTRRALLSLEQLGYVAMASDGHRFVPLPVTLDLGYARLSRLTFGELVQPHLEHLVERVRHSASLSVLAGDDVVYVARVHTVQIMRVTIALGTRLPAYATSTGRVLLAALPARELAAYLARANPRPLTEYTVTSVAELAARVAAAREHGYALVEQEMEEGLRSIAVPVRDLEGRVVAALNVAMHAGRSRPEDVLGDVLPALREAAVAIEADLAVAMERTDVAIP